MQLIIRRNNCVNEIEFNEILIIQDSEYYFIEFIENDYKNEDIETIHECIYEDPVVAEYVFNLICEYINTDKIFYLKTEKEYKAELKEFEKIFKEKYED